MKTREDKRKEVAELHALLEAAPAVFLTSFEKLTVEDDFQLRKAVREAGGRYRVVKNSLIQLASAGTPAEPLFRNLTGMNSLVFANGDPVAVAKVLKSYAQEHPTFTFKAALVEGRLIDAAGIQRLAELPSREEVFAKLLGLIQAPATALLRAMQGVARNLAVVLDQAVKENKFPAS